MFTTFYISCFLLKFKENGQLLLRIRFATKNKKTKFQNVEFYEATINFNFFKLTRKV